MLPLTEFKKPLVYFSYGGPRSYYRKHPVKLNQTFPMPTLQPPQPQPRLLPENIKRYEVDFLGRRLY